VAAFQAFDKNGDGWVSQNEVRGRSRFWTLSFDGEPCVCCCFLGH
jgi:hypothetical protein